jgi:hypothetical protein
MPQFLLIVGALLVLVGMGSIAAGAPDWVLGLSLGATLIQSGTIAFVGGLILIALGMVLFVMQDLLKRLNAVAPANTTRSTVIAPPGTQRQQPAPEPGPRARESAPDPAGEESPRQPREQATGNEPSRPRRERPREPAPDEAARQRRPALLAPSAEDQLRPRREGAAPDYPEGGPARPRAPRTLDQASDDLVRMRSEYAATGKREELAPPRRDPGPIPLLPQPFSHEARKRASEPAPELPEPYVPKFRPADSPAPASSNAAADTVVRSGVIGGMAYTLYADGSIEAELAIGTVRFDSIAELQDHVTRTGAEADADFDETTR